MRKRFVGMVLACMLAAGFAAGGCGNNSSKMDMSQSAGGNMDNKADFNGMDDAYTEEVASDDSAMSQDQSSEEGALLEGNGDTGKETKEKRIYTYRYSAETKAFDEFLAAVTEKTEALGGYVQDSETNGSAVDQMNRYANITLRIPADKMDQMLSLVNTEANVVYSNVSTQNVTLKYVDMESHIKALRTEQKTLLRLIEQAEKIDDVIALQSQLTQVRYEIESYESQLREMDNLVEYSTLILDITEVLRTTTVTGAKTGFLDEIKNSFSDNLYAVGQWLRGAVIWLIGSLPVLVLSAAGIAVLVFVGRKWQRRRKQKLQKEMNELKPGYDSIYLNEEHTESKEDTDTESNPTK